MATPRHDYEATVAAIAALVRDAEAERSARACTVGIGIPGAISPATGLVKNANSTWLNGRPLQADLERALCPRGASRQRRELPRRVGSQPTAPRPVRDVVFGVIVGTGTGGGIVVNGRVLTGPNADRRRVGAQSAARGPTRKSSPARSATAGRSGASRRSSRARASRPTTGGAAVASSPARRSSRGPDCRRTARRSARSRPGRAGWPSRWRRSSTCSIPTSSSSGGGLSRIQSIYTDVPRHWGAWVFSDVVRTRFVPSKYGDASGVRGAAWLWEDACQSQSP